MESLLTRCPYCGANFYKNVPDDEELTSMDLECPYCNYTYRDMIEESRIKNHDFYWEIYSGLYPIIRLDNHKNSRLLIGGILLLLTLPFFIYGFSQLFLPGNLSGYSGTELNSIYGLGLAGLIFLIFILSGVISAIKGYSFVLSLSGIIFALLSSVLWYYLTLNLSPNIFGDFTSLFLLVPQILAIISLTFFIRNRRSFKLGY